jgi:hypothetical protein
MRNIDFRLFSTVIIDHNHNNDDDHDDGIQLDDDDLAITAYDSHCSTTLSATSFSPNC